MAKQSFEAFLEGRDNRRAKNEARAYDRLDRQMDAAEAMIGQLSSGKLYVFPVGGKYREGTRQDLISFLIRNRYV
jgi:hypothetical protein